MRRTNKLVALPRHDWQKSCLFEAFIAACAFWNQVNYRRQQAERKHDDWETATYSDLYDEYAPVISKATCQQLVRKNSEAWRSYDRLSDKYETPNDASVTDEPGYPDYWGNRDDGYDLRTVVRGDLYHIDWNADTSTISIPVGKALNDKYDIPGRGYQVELELKGEPRWKGQPCQLDVWYDEDSESFRVHQPVDVQPDYVDLVRENEFPTTTLQQENAEPDDETASAAIDVGANNTLTIVTSDGDVAVFHARPEFERFRAQYEEIGELQSNLPPFTYSSERVRRRYDEMYAQRDHHRDAAVKHAARWLRTRNVDTVYVGDLSDVLSTHWSASVNQKTYNFWSHGRLTDRLDESFGLVDIDLEIVGEQNSSSTCPHCSSEDVARHGDEFACDDCGLESHADVVGAALILTDNEDVSFAEWFEPWPMARPVARTANSTRDGGLEFLLEVTYFQWDDHEWTPRASEAVGTLGSFDQRSVDEPASPSGWPTGRLAQRGIPRL
jgi:putative transposase